MAKIISLVNQKGGVGKTTSAINLSSYLADAGKKVLLVDLDPQGNASSGLGVAGKNKNGNLYHNLVDKVHPRETIVSVKSSELELIPSDQDLAGAAIELADIENREYQLYELLRQIRNDYDYILIDSPPSLGLLTINGLVASDEVIVPVQTEYFALEGLGQLLNTIDLVKENLQPKLEIGGILLTMYDRRNRLANQVVKEVRNYFPDHVFDSVVPRTVRLAEAPGFGKSILNFDAFNKGARAYRQLAEELIIRHQGSK
ncbi:MAG: AAA family ATPase [Patescibacteria group bacterium]|jgi:chromosome partitioning protein|nr:AAA family ATPase [Patescibacteria group bacterium]